MLLLIGLAVLISAYLLYSRCVSRSERCVTIRDFAVSMPPEKHRTSAQDMYKIINKMAKEHKQAPELVTFLGRMLQNAGIGDASYYPARFREMSYADSQRELGADGFADFTGIFDDAFERVQTRTGLSPADFDFLIVNCSLWSPTPSISAWIVNHLHMSPAIRTFSLGGMGCSASVIAVDLAKSLLEAHPTKRALVVSAEMLSDNYYTGNERSYGLQSVLFRIGLACIVMEGQKTAKSRYTLDNLVRVHHGMKDAAYDCIQHIPDDKGHVGVRLQKTIASMATACIKENIETLSKQLGESPFSAADHFCFHTGGRGILDALESNFGLTNDQMEASRATLHRYGNTSSSSIWYELAYIESFKGVKAGDRVLQLAFGSGFKANSTVLTALGPAERNAVPFDATDPGWTLADAKPAVIDFDDREFTEE